MENSLLIEAVRLYAGEELLKNLSDSGAMALQRKLKPIDVTILAMDLEPFTDVPGSSAEQMVRLLESYLDLVADIIAKHHGFLTQITGNAVLSYWPTSAKGSANNVVNCALECVNSIPDVAKELRPSCGIASGIVFLGNIGAKSRMQYTILGDKVNLAMRLQVANRQYQSQILHCGVTDIRLDPSIQRVLVATVRQKGTGEPLSIFRVK